MTRKLLIFPGAFEKMEKNGEGVFQLKKALKMTIKPNNLGYDLQPFL